MDPTADFVRLWIRHQAEYLFMMIPRQADGAEVLQEIQTVKVEAGLVIESVELAR